MIKLTGNRIQYNEGRNSGFSYMFLNNKYELIHPMSPCKDYLNDVVWGEKHKKSCSAYGMNHKPIGLWNNSKRAYLAIGYTDNDKPKEEHKKKYKKKILENYDKIKSLIRAIDLYLDFKPTIFKKYTNGMIKCSLDKKWVSETYLISLFTLLIRNGSYWDGDIFSSLKTASEKNNQDTMYIIKTIEKLKYFKENGLIKVNDSNSANYTVHNAGIINLKIN